LKKAIILLLIPILSFCQLEKYEDYMPTSSTGNVGHHSYYSFSFSKKHGSSEWTIYYSKIRERKYGRGNINFKQDPDYTEFKVNLDAYYRNPYDRSHMVPAASMSFDSIALVESFYTTNVTPMLDANNRGAWKKLEAQERNWVKEKNDLIVVTGVIFQDENYEFTSNLTEFEKEFENWFGLNKMQEVKLKDGKTGKLTDVSIPAFTFKVIVDIKNTSAIAFAVPNDFGAYEILMEEIDLKSFIHTIDEIEDLTGIDFNYKLPRSIQKSLESKVNIRDWFEIDKVSIGGKKLALLIGNNDYTNDNDKLENPINDAFKMEETFKKLDFDSIIIQKNLDYSKLKKTFSNYIDLREDYDFGVVYYAGHGIQDESGNSYLIPVDYDDSKELKNNSFSVNDFIENLKDKQKNDILILDACRETSSSTISKPNVSDLKSLKLGYSTLSGYPAYDHPELNNSLYTKILSESLLNSDLTIYEIFHQTKIKVLLQSFHRQVPDQAFGDDVENFQIK